MTCGLVGVSSYIIRVSHPNLFLRLLFRLYFIFYESRPGDQHLVSRFILPFCQLHSEDFGITDTEHGGESQNSGLLFRHSSGQRFDLLSFRALLLLEPSTTLSSLSAGHALKQEICLCIS